MAEETEKTEEFTLTISELREGGETITFTIPRLLEWMAAVVEAEKLARAPSPIQEKKSKGEQQ